MITKESLDKMRLNINDYFSDFEKMFGAKVEIGNISFDELSFTFRTNITMEEVQSMQSERQFFKENCQHFGLKPTDYLHEFRMQAEEGKKAEVFEVFGFDLGSQRPIKARSIVDGEVMTFDVSILDDIKDTHVKSVSNKIKEPPKLIRRNR